jgi:hypothetical protein
MRDPERRRAVRVPLGVVLMVGLPGEAAMVTPSSSPWRPRAARDHSKRTCAPKHAEAGPGRPPGRTRPSGRPSHSVRPFRLDGRPYETGEAQPA